MGLKELAVSKAPANEWRARSIWKTEKEQKVNQRFWKMTTISSLWSLFFLSGGSSFSKVSLVLILLRFATIVETVFMLC